MRTRRTFFQEASSIATGLALAVNADVAFAESAEKISIDNNYSEPVDIDLFHPLDFDKVFATWTIASTTKKTLIYEDKLLLVKADWGIRVRFRNGAQSAVMRLFEVGYSSTVKASDIYDKPIATYYQSFRRIATIEGNSIDRHFGSTETSLLKDALAYFYDRFLQDHIAGCPELRSRAAFDHYELEEDDFEEAEDERDFISIQRSRFSANNQVGRPFPKLEIEYENEPDTNGSGWLARAHLGIVKILPKKKKGDVHYPVDGSFKIQVNDFFLNNSQRYKHYSSPAFWGGVIAHEVLHNLGHAHPKSRSANDYYLHQMVIIENLVMTGQKVRYGTENPTPVLCMKRPT
jgi:hypothetical protein